MRFDFYRDIYCVFLNALDFTIKSKNALYLAMGGGVGGGGGGELKL